MSNKKIGLIPLTAIVISSMIGAAIFSLPQNLALVADVKAILFSWVITGSGIIFLGLAFFFVSRLKPELDGGVYTYARDGFGDLMGFLSAWGYWFCVAIGMVGYLVVAFEGLGSLFDREGYILFGKGNTIVSLLGASIAVWLVHALVAKGVWEASFVNLVATVVKLFPLLLFIGLAIWYFSPDIFHQGLEGSTLSSSVPEQIKYTMPFTLWVFTGVEGAAILSSHAKRRSDVGLATVIGICFVLIIDVSVTVLAFGIVPREIMAQMQNPSLGGLLAEIIGPSGRVLVTSCLIVSVLSCYMSWTMYASEVPYRCAKNGAFPKILDKTNENGIPINALWFTSTVVQLSLLMVFLTENNYSFLVVISTSMILVPYFLVAVYLVKVAFQLKSPWYIKFVASMATIYGLWNLYAVGLENIFLTVLLYTPGLVLYLYSRYHYLNHKLHLRFWEKIVIATFVCLFVVAIKQVFIV